MRGKDACYGLSSILLPKIVQAELCDNGWGELAGQLRAMLAQGHLRKRGWAPCAVTVLPARVELGSSYDTPTPAPSHHTCQNHCQRPCGKSLSWSQADLGFDPTLPRFTEPPGTNRSAPKPQFLQP